MVFQFIYVMIKYLPNIMSMSRFPLALIGTYTFTQQNYIATIGIIFLCFFTDFFDGKIARAHNVQSKFGRWTDHLADRFCLICICKILYDYNPHFFMLAIPGFLNSYLQVVFALKFKEEVKVSQIDRIWFLIAALLIPILIIWQIMHPESKLHSANEVILIFGTILGFISVVQYTKQYVDHL